MPKAELTQFIITELAKGEGKQEITNKLLFKGNNIEEINEAFASINEQPAVQTPPDRTVEINNAHVFSAEAETPRAATVFASPPTQNPIGEPKKCIHFPFRKIIKIFIILVLILVLIGSFIYFQPQITNLIKNFNSNSAGKTAPAKPQPTTTVPMSNGGNSVVNSADDIKRFNDINAVQNALDQYFIDNKTYPSNLGQLAPKYISTLPQDPKTQKPYTYQMENFTKPDYLLCGIFDNNVQKCFSVGVRSSTYNQ